MRITGVLDALDPDALAAFWAEALRYRVAQAFGQYRVLLPLDGDPAGPVVAVQGVDAATPGKNRMHVDLHPKDPEAHLVRLQRLGATPVGVRVEEFGTWWQVMADPEGNEFCVVAGAEGPDEGHASTG
jgi:predicted enzyme related to lactoylglutathione lyase